MTIPLSSDHSWDHAGDHVADQGIARSIDTWNRSDLSAHSADCCRTWAGSVDPGNGDRCKRKKFMHVKYTVLSKIFIYQPFFSDNAWISSRIKYC
jgi:hypothetical protein